MANYKYPFAIQKQYSKFFMKVFQGKIRLVKVTVSIYCRKELAWHGHVSKRVGIALHMLYLKAH